MHVLPSAKPEIKRFKESGSHSTPSEIGGSVSVEPCGGEETLTKAHDKRRFLLQDRLYSVSRIAAICLLFKNAAP